MKSGVENCHLRLGQKDGLAFPDACEVGGIVQRGELAVEFDGPGHIGVDDHGSGILLSSMHHAVSDPADFIHRPEDAALGVEQRSHHQFKGFSMAGNGLFPIEMPVFKILFDAAEGLSDTLHLAFAEAELLRHLVDLILEAGAAAVDH